MIEGDKMMECPEVRKKLPRDREERFIICELNSKACSKGYGGECKIYDEIMKKMEEDEMEPTAR